MAHAATEPVKYLFERAFDGPRPPDAEDIEAIRAEAYAQGFAAAKQETEQHTATALSAIGQAMGRVGARLDAETDRISNQAATLALITARKLARTLVERAPQSAVQSVIAESLSHLPRDTRIVIAVAASQAADLARLIETLPEAAFNAGGVVIEASESLNPGDCEIRWADGEIIHNPSQIHARIDRIIETHLPDAARAAGPVLEGEDLTAIHDTVDADSAHNRHASNDQDDQTTTMNNTENTGDDDTSP